MNLSMSFNGEASGLSALCLHMQTAWNGSVIGIVRLNGWRTMPSTGFLIRQSHSIWNSSSYRSYLEP